MLYRMGLLCSFCFYPPKEVDTEYGDYIFNHSNVLRLQVSELLTEYIKKGDYIVLHVKINQEKAQHTCLVYAVGKSSIYISLIDEWKQINGMEFIKSITI